MSPMYTLDLKLKYVLKIVLSPYWINNFTLEIANFKLSMLRMFDKNKTL